MEVLLSPMICGRKLQQKRVVLIVTYCTRHHSASLHVGQSCTHQEVKGLCSSCFLLSVTLFLNAFSSWVHDSDSCFFCSVMGFSKAADKDARSIILKYWQQGSKIDSGKGQRTVNLYFKIFQPTKWLFSQMSHADRNCR